MKNQIMGLGKHLIIEFYECHPDILDDKKLIEEGMLQAARRANATIIGCLFNHFFPHGVSGVVVIAESHLSIHTWPEYQYAAVDFFTCGPFIDPKVALSHLQAVLGSKHFSCQEIIRGAQFAGCQHKPPGT